jgi:hypothetical protein
LSLASWFQHFVRAMRETAPRHKREVTMGVAVVVIIAVVAPVAI